ncbi:MAG: hypothetical protein A2Z07_03905 [Armatimonadetes bacterium RBG_16_67_12]|nr:MAG: hypothetical protein A2Z07_03905 [Armatimonadetes bacterium RBG_16_67_12]
MIVLLLAVGILIVLVSVVIQVELARRLVRTRHLQIVDAAGRVRIAVGVAKEDVALMTLFDAQGTARMRVGAPAHAGSFLYVSDDRGKERIRLAQHLDGSSGLVLLDSTGAPRGGLLVSKGDVPELSLLDGKRGLSAGLQAWDEGVRFTILDATQRERFEVKLVGDGAPSVRVLDATGAALFEIPGRGQEGGATGPPAAPAGDPGMCV